MLNIYGVISLLSILFGYATCQIICPYNQEFTDCGTACPRNCRNLYGPPTACTLQCVPGCFCPSGSALLDSGYCADINSIECLEEFAGENCTADKIFNSCGTACPERCTDLFLPPQPCNRSCNRGCFCPNGQALLLNGSCADKESLQCLIEARRGPLPLLF